MIQLWDGLMSSSLAGGWVIREIGLELGCGNTQQELEGSLCCVVVLILIQYYYYLMYTVKYQYL